MTNGFEVAGPGTLALIEKMKDLLRAAKCPNDHCGGQGWYADQIDEGEWEQVECQFCAERGRLLDG